MSDLEKPEVREELLDRHPIVTRKYLAVTPMIESAYGVIRERIWLRRSGLFLYAKPRMGKTSCLDAVKRMIAHEFPDKYSSVVSADKYRSSNFVKDLMNSVNAPRKPRETYHELLERLLLYIESKLADVRGDHYVLLIDEIQNLSHEGYDVLLTIHNRLAQKGISMTTVSFGQPEILERRTGLFANGSTNLVARFLSEPISFPGCSSKNDLRGILNSFDDTTEYPDGSGWSYTRFFFPEAFGAGFKLSVYLDLIWLGLRQCTEKTGITSMPLEHLFRIVECLLLKNRRLDSPNFSLDSEIIEAAIDSSSVREFMSLMSQTSFHE